MTFTTGTNERMRQRRKACEDSLLGSSTREKEFLVVPNKHGLSVQKAAVHDSVGCFALTLNLTAVMGAKRQISYCLSVESPGFAAYHVGHDYFAP